MYIESAEWPHLALCIDWGHSCFLYLQVQNPQYESYALYNALTGREKHKMSDTTYRFDCYACDRDDNEIVSSLQSVTIEEDNPSDLRVIRRLDAVANSYPNHTVWSTLWRITENSRTCLQTYLYEQE